MRNAHLDVDTSDVSAPKELYLMSLLIERVVVVASVLSRVPVKHKLAVVHSPDSLLLFDYAQVTLLVTSNVVYTLYTSLVHYSAEHFYKI